MAKTFIVASWITSFLAVLAAGWRALDGVREVDHSKSSAVSVVALITVAGVCAIAVASLMALDSVHKQDTSLRELQERTAQERIRYGPKGVS
jgi:hypothetical protein